MIYIFSQPPFFASMDDWVIHLPVGIQIEVLYNNIEIHRFALRFYDKRRWKEWNSRLSISRIMYLFTWMTAIIRKRKIKECIEKARKL